jgi:hypothetical protein
MLTKSTINNECINKLPEAPINDNDRVPRAPKRRLQSVHCTSCSPKEEQRQQQLISGPIAAAAPTIYCESAF